jgi:lipopolysaccharide export system permease protein
MKTISLYILRETLAILAAAVAVALVALVLERMLRLIDLTMGSDGSVLIIFKMMMNLLPHYLGVALPLAFFLAVMLAFNRLSQDSELAVLHSSGISLFQLLMPVMALAIVFTILTGIIFGYLQPYGRYAYRALVHAVSHASVASALKEGAFVETDGMVFIADKVSVGGRRLSRVFVHEEKEDGKSVTTTGRSGTLTEVPDDFRPVLQLRDGFRVEWKPGAAAAVGLRFDEMTWAIGPVDPARTYRRRGSDEEELTLSELWPARLHPPQGVSRGEVSAELHVRLVRTFSILVLPLLAIPFGLSGNRVQRLYGMALGILILVVYHKLLELGDALARTDYLSPWLSLWAPLTMFALGCGYLFFRVGSTTATDPVSRFVERLQDAAEFARATAVWRKPSK